MRIFSGSARVGTLFIVLMFGMWACNSHSDFKETKSGLKYKIHFQDESKKKVELFDVVEVYMNYRTEDSILFSGNNSMIPFQIEPIYEGDLMEGMMLMHLGDSATFIMDTEDFFLKMMQFEKIPDYALEDDQLFFDIKVATVRPETPTIKAKRLELKNRKADEAGNIEAYVAKNNITVEPTESGLYMIRMSEGSGQKASNGDKVKLHYSGYFLDGSKYVSSRDRNVPVSFTLGQGEVIAGWEEAVQEMNVGEKVKLIIPSALAYGGGQRDRVEPYTPLVFELELIEIKN